VIEITGDAWQTWQKLQEQEECFLCITTNGTLRKDGACVMGAGIAKEAARQFDWVAKDLGRNILMYGNVMHYLGHNLVSFPVKHNWWETADIELIKRSCNELIAFLDSMAIERDVEECTAILVRPGCGNGKLDWETEVKPVISSLLDDRVYIITF
jgi:hypothetical protein